MTQDGKVELTFTEIIIWIFGSEYDETYPWHCQSQKKDVIDNNVIVRPNYDVINASSINTSN